MEKILLDFASPKTDDGKFLRESVLAIVGAMLIAGLQTLDSINFGDVDIIVTAIVGVLLMRLNRYLRPESK